MLKGEKMSVAEWEKKRGRDRKMEIKDECFSKCLAQIEPKYPNVKIKNNCQKATIRIIRIQYQYSVKREKKTPTNKKWK